MIVNLQLEFESQVQNSNYWQTKPNQSIKEISSF
jgi:hypothetical protein